MPSQTDGENLERWRLRIVGQVQGVGFRPWAYRQATVWHLSGCVYNDLHGVVVEIEGRDSALRAFEKALHHSLPPLCRIDDVYRDILIPRGDSTFVIGESVEGGPGLDTLVLPDAALCVDCQRELADPGNRRYRYPFINCTNCGPRFTIIKDVPYDRDKTTMAEFDMCLPCLTEYHNPGDRRFHAEPNACADCGPKVSWRTQGDAEHFSWNAIKQAAGAIVSGAVIALKGIGGYHLACNAYDARAVRKLRLGKRRYAKPFAVMARDLDAINRHCRVTPRELEELTNPRHSIVLLALRDADPLAKEIYQPYRTLGVMLPYTPLHVLLLNAVRDIGGPPILVMTSGNRADEPILITASAAHDRLAEIADGWLDHNRAINIRCDDSIVQMAADGLPQVLRRARGFVPDWLTLPISSPLPLLAVGGHLKNTFGVARGHRAILSQHIGDLGHQATWRSFREGIEHFQNLFAIQPNVIVHDLHPEYLSTKYAMESDKRLIGVQHHHAHIASVMAEHGLVEPVIGIAADGTGYGPDGILWGGEIFVAELDEFTRVGHLRKMPLIGGEQAIYQPWRMALAYLDRVGARAEWWHLGISSAVDPDWVKQIFALLDKRYPFVQTTSLGRFFDAVSALVGERHVVSYEGQAAIELEMGSTATRALYSYAIDEDALSGCLIMDPSAMILEIVNDLRRGMSKSLIGGKVHRTVADMLTQAACRVREANGIDKVALSGGVFQNRLLCADVLELLTACGFKVYFNHWVPPNDGGLSYGQLAVAAARLARGIDPMIMTKGGERHVSGDTRAGG